jgi:hypothetical protein
VTDLNTPFTEIAHLLPTENAARLALLAAPIQAAVLTDVRFLVTQWEQSGVDLDPITFSRVLGPAVDLLTVNAMAIYSIAAKDGVAGLFNTEGGA